MINWANGITLCRMAGSVALAGTRPFSPAFYALYLLCGVSDMLDGPVARRTGCASPAGGRLDSAADLLFAGVCLWKLLPVLAVPVWLWAWIAGIVVIRGVNLLCGWVSCRRIVLLHTTANRAAGLLVFVLPLVLPAVPLEPAAAVACAVATFASVQEGHFIRTGRM